VKRLLAAIVAATLVFSVAFAAAATLTVNGGAIQAGSDTSLWCDPDGVFVAGWGLETDDGLVYSVRIGGIEGSCFGNDLFANITAAGGVTLTKATAVNPINATEEVLTFVTPQLASAIEDIHVFIEGPAGL
jgi:hypothetical protein